MERFDAITGSLLTWVDFQARAHRDMGYERRLHSHVKRGKPSSRGNSRGKKRNTTQHGTIYICITHLLKLAMPALGTPDWPDSDCDRL